MTTAEDRRDRIRKNAAAGIQSIFPIIGGKYSLDVEKLILPTGAVPHSEQKAALLEGRTLVEPIKGEMVLRDTETGKIVDKSTRTLLHLPYYTERHTFVMGGNDYQVANQLRIKPGVYTRVRDNGQVESSFNLGRGRNFRLSLDPERGVLFQEYATAKIPLLLTLRILGATDAEIRRYWGSELFDVNRTYLAGKELRYKEQLFRKVVPVFLQKNDLDEEAKEKLIKETIENSLLDPQVTELTLGSGFNSVNDKSLLFASRKLIRVFQEEEQPDDRDSLGFKTLHTVESLVQERIEKDAGREVKSKTKRKLARTGYNQPTINGVLGSAPFTKSVHRFLTGSALAATPPQINPVEMIDSSLKVTSLGEGGISSTLAVPDEARDVHSSHLGILDPIRTPESGKAGVDIRATMHAYYDAKGNLYAPLRNVKTNKIELVRADRALKSSIAFPGQTDLLKGKGRAGKTVDALRDNQVVALDAKDIDYEVATPHNFYSPATALTPLLDSMQGNRAVMGAKYQTQALPLKEKEAPLVQVKSWAGSPEKSMESAVGKMTVPVSPVDGVVEKIDKDYIYIRPTKIKTSEAHAAHPLEFVKTAAPRKKDDDLVKVPIAHLFPLMSKTFLHDEVKVKVGDRVTRGQVLADNNFTQDGTLAMGRNLTVAYMPYYGKNSNDAVVISETAAKKLTSLHMYKESIQLDVGTVVDLNKHKAYSGARYTAAQYAALGSDGVARKGSKVDPGDILIAGLRATGPTAQSSMLGKMHKSLVRPWTDAAVTWTHAHPGEVVDVVRTQDRIVLTVRTEEPMVHGDKILARHANKGVVSEIIPDDKMIQGPDGKPVDIILSSAGVITRINPSQIIETAVAKVADKTGEPVLLEPFAPHDNVDWAKKLLAKHKIKDKEDVFDPISGKTIKGVMVGKQYFFKGFKSTDTNFAARGIGPGYDSNLMPSRGGTSGAKSVGKMEFNALIAHNARNVLRDSAAVKSQRNDEYWRAVQLGLPTPPPSQQFAYDKFQHLLTGAGIKVDKDGTRMTLMPLTDRDVDAITKTEVKNPLMVTPRLVGGVQQLQPEKGGLFDPVATGGLDGDRYTRITLAEPVVNPVFHEPARRLLGMSKKDFDKEIHTKGAADIKQRLNALDLAAEEKRLRQEATKTTGSTRDGAVKQLKYIRALNRENLRPGDAYVLSKIPVTPPKVRPILPAQDGSTLIADANYLYRDVMLANEAIKDTPKALRTPAAVAAQREHLQASVTALFGLGESVSPATQKRGVSGYIEQITGSSSPKHGFFQSRLMSRRQDLSGRATIAPDVTLGIDEVGLPEEMAWEMYEPFIIKRLIRSGYTAVDARSKWKNRHEAARRALQEEVLARPVMVNRAPTLHRYGFVGAHPKLIPGKTLTIPQALEKGMNADFDGDTMQVHVPVSDAAVAEVKSMTMSNLIFGDGSKDDMMVFPAHEALIGAYLATNKRGSGPPKRFKTKGEAMAAYHRGEIKLSTPVIIGN